MSISKKRKDELVAKYMTKDIPELTDFQKSWVKKETAHYIFVDRDENGNHTCHCDGCDQDIDLGKTKHLSEVKCPACGKKMTVFHLWRRQREVTYDWVVIPRAIDKETIMLRYVLAFRNIDGCSITELARMVITPDPVYNYTFELEDDIWKYTERHWFSPSNMGWLIEKKTCRYAKEYTPTWKRELKKLDCVRYFDDYEDFRFCDPHGFYKGTSYDDLNILLNRGSLYEKLCKAGMKDLAKEDCRHWCHGDRYDVIDFDRNETSLVKMLRLNRNQFDILKKNPTSKAYHAIKKFADMKPEELELIVETNTGESDIKVIKDHKLSLIHTLRYFKKAGCEAGEWTHYLSMLEKLNYKLDSMYLYPRDFRKMDESISDEYDEVLYGKEDSERDKAIRKISKALHEMKELREFFKGSSGLQVVVPELSKDFRRESRYMHHCVKTYPDRVANGNTLIFFIRRIEDPTAPYVTMEYAHGKIVQCRYAYNVSVKDTKIINFAERLAERLARQNILVA